MDSFVDVRETIEQAKDTITARRVFGEPVEKDGVTVIPAARVQGGAGGGGGQAPDGQGSGGGSGFGVNAKPAGVFVISGEDVRWQPALDVTKIVVGAQVVAVAALLLAARIVRVRAAKTG